jgi:hypothetical protein
VNEVIGNQLVPLEDANGTSGQCLFIRVVLSDVLGGKDVVEGRDGRTVGFVY